MQGIAKTYDHQSLQDSLYDAWVKKGLFKCDPTSSKKPFTIMMPPPNVTGNLHLGHALTYTIQDIALRYQRMQGKDVLFQCGTDHAGIATQMLVEKQLLSEGITRHELGREKFLNRVWDWKNKYGSAIESQQKKMGITADWDRSRFTMDEGLSKAVRKIFVQLYKDNLIYRDKRLVNWDCKLLTAVSDLEVEDKETKGKMYYFKYPFKNDASKHITVGTTRPETVFGDVAVAVNPNDDRYKDFVEQTLIMPLNGRELIIVADDYSDPEKGTGAVKITPAHDFNDFEAGERHQLDRINVIDIHGKMNEECPTKYQGLDRFDARKQVIADMEEMGLLEKIEDVVHMIPHGDRSGTVLEPRLTDQWFADAKTLAQPAIEAVERGDTEFIPSNWTNTYFEWLRNIRPWCISRQIWWGHRIPAWYGPDGKVFVSETEADAYAEATAHYGTKVELTQDEDVLDTWFSSGLWPFSTLGWPEQTSELNRYYSTDVLVTGFDIIFFWVARMMMMGLFAMKEVPFKKVYIHALIRDEKGQKMSKTKGNVIDPLEVIEKYGTDALRFTLAQMAVPGKDIKMSMERVESGRNFVTKLWNAARYADMQGCTMVAGFDPIKDSDLTVNRWIATEVQQLIQTVTEAIDSYRFSDATNALYSMTRGTFCDWYIEFTKPILNGENEKAKQETRATMMWVLRQLLVLWHPIMPYVTDELWKAFNPDVEVNFLMEGSWATPAGEDTNSQKEMQWVIDAITATRTLRAELNVPPSATVEAAIQTITDEESNYLERNQALVERLARININNSIPGKLVQVIAGGTTFGLDIRNVIDVEAEVKRLQKDIEKTEKDLTITQNKLKNEDFVSRAPEHILEENKEREKAFLDRIEKLKAALELVEG